MKLKAGNQTAGEKSHIVLLRHNYLEHIHSTECLCPTHSSARMWLHKPCQPASSSSSQLWFPSKAIDGLHPHDRTDHVPINERAGLLGQCRSLGQRERSKLSALHSRGWTKNPGDMRQTQNVNTCGNAGTPCLTQRSFLEQHCDHHTEVGWWSPFHHPQPPSPSPLPSPAGTGLSSSAQQNAISFTFPISLKLHPVSNA